MNFNRPLPPTIIHMCEHFFFLSSSLTPHSVCSIHIRVKSVARWAFARHFFAPRLFRLLAVKWNLAFFFALVWRRPKDISGGLFRKTSIRNLSLFPPTVTVWGIFFYLPDLNCMWTAESRMTMSTTTRFPGLKDLSAFSIKLTDGDWFFFSFERD